MQAAGRSVAIPAERVVNNMTADDPATEIANCFSECLNAVAVIASSRVLHWHRTIMTAEARKSAILEALSRVADVAPLLDLPQVDGPKDALRHAALAAAELRRMVATWD